MEFTKFFSDITIARSSEKPLRIILSSSEYPPLVMDAIKQYILAEMPVLEMHSLDMSASLADIERTLSTTFLGQNYCYWMGNSESYTAYKKKKEFLDYIKNYRGPHSLIIWIPQEAIAQFDTEDYYELKDFYHYDDIKKVSFLYPHKNTVSTYAYFYTKLYALKKEYSLEQLCMLKEYVPFLGSNIDYFFDAWINNLIVSDVSLFYISQAFFEKNAHVFFQKWRIMKDHYSEQFWTSYFSEQLLKAYYYILHQGKIPPESKSITFGLAFSFLKHDWKLHTLQSLHDAHQRMYTIDLQLKLQNYHNGYYLLDLFLMEWFQHSYMS